MERTSDTLGRIRIRTVQVPDFVENTYYGHFTCTGSVLFSYTQKGAPYRKDYFRLGVMQPDGSGFHPVYAGMIPTIPKANGIRFLPLADNRRIITGDYMIECTPDIDHCEHAEVVRIYYPEGLWEDAGTLQSWTEIIMSPDCVHIAWTTIRNDIGAVNFYGRLERREDGYHVTSPQVISNLQNFVPGDDGRLHALTSTGGELKQFIHGGMGISFAGSDRAGTLDAMVLNLADNTVTPVTRTPGYDETAIFSPDEKLALVMTTRFSPKTDGRIFSIVPRPLKANPTLGISMAIYTFAVMDVRRGREEGSIGPALIEVGRSQTQKGYLGTSLEPEEAEKNWVFNSPMSWHPDGRMAMWNEVDRTRRSEDGFGIQRIRIAELLEYHPGKAAAPADCPDQLSFGEPFSMELLRKQESSCDVTIPGAAGGAIRFVHGDADGYATVVGTTSTVYDHYSDDGIRFWNGYEKVRYAPVGETVYEAELTVEDRTADSPAGDTGEHAGTIVGEMHLRVVYSKSSMQAPYRIDRTPDKDGVPESHGYSRYYNERADVSEMAE